MPDTPLNPEALDETALANLIAWKSLPFGATQFVKLDANAAHKVIELLKPHLAVAQPEVQRKLAISVKALGLVASLHTPVESIELGQECRICSIPYPCMTRRVADEALQAIEREVSP